MRARALHLAAADRFVSAQEKLLDAGPGPLPLLMQTRGERIDAR